MWSPSTPASTSHLHTWIDSSSVVPSFAHGKSALPSSIALILNWRWKSSPISLRIARTTSSGKRARFSSEPPYSSVRSLMAGERNCVIR